jgi:hypothetical protein
VLGYEEDMDAMSDIHCGGNFGSVGSTSALLGILLKRLL